MTKMQIFQLLAVAIVSVAAVHADPSLPPIESDPNLPPEDHDPSMPPIPSDEVADILNVVVMDAKTQAEKEMMEKNIKELIKDITEIAKNAVRLFYKNKKIFDKVTSIFESAEPGTKVSDGDEAALEMLQTTLLMKVQDVILEDDGSAERSLLISDVQPNQLDVGLANNTK